MTDENVESLILHQLRALDAKVEKMAVQMVEAFERVYVEVADVKTEVMKCRADVAASNQSSKEVAVRLTLLEKRVAQLEEARP